MNAWTFLRGRNGWAGGLYELDKWVAGLISYVIIRWRRRADPVQSEGEERRGGEGSERE